jgi:DNA-binding HxlR family transcriptional regulator
MAGMMSVASPGASTAWPGVTPRPRGRARSGRRWTGAILFVVRGGARRFGDIAAAVPGLTDRMLSGRLKELEVAGILTRTVVPEMPVRVDY